MMVRSVALPLLLLLLLAHRASAATTYRPLQPELWPGADVAASVARLSRALQFKTASVPPPPAGGGGDGASGGGGKGDDAVGLEDASQMRQLHAHLRRSYPAVFRPSADASASRGGGLAWLKKLTGGGTLTNANANANADADANANAADTANAATANNYVSFEALGCGGLSLLVTVRGSKHATLRPILLVSHLDVVPAANAGDWAHPPFSGAVAGGEVWGRGAVDVKGPAVALLEALQALLAPPSSLQSPWRPERTVMVALGHDEEVGGACGAQRIAAHLLAAQRQNALGPDGLLLHALWDEGAGVMLDGIAPLVSRSTALIGTAEKRAARVVARARAAGGHASMPPIPRRAAASRWWWPPRPWRRQQAPAKATTTTNNSSSSGSSGSSDTGLTVGAALGRLLAAVDATPPVAELRAPTTDMLLAAAPHADRPGLRLLLPLACRFLPPLRPVLARALAASSAGGASLVRTTAVATRVTVGGPPGGPGENVLPQSGEAVFNVRLLPGWGERELAAYFAARVAEALGEEGGAGGDGGDGGDGGGGGGGGGGKRQLEVLIGERGRERPLGEGAGEGGPPVVAPSEGPAFDALKRAIEWCWRFEEARGTLEGEGGGGGGGGARLSSSSSSSSLPPLVLPSLLMGMTDSRHYRALVAPARRSGGGGGGGTLRFLPLGLTRESLSRIHGTDERVSIDDFARAMCTYRAGIVALAALPPAEDEVGAEAGGGGSAATSSGDGARSTGGGEL